MTQRLDRKGHFETAFKKVRPLKKAQFGVKSRKMIPPSAGLATGIHGVFRGLKFESDAELVPKGAIFKGLKGFTLIEILVVITLLAMAGTLVSVNVGKSLAHKKPKAFAQQMISLCKTARRVAVDHGRPMTVYISSSKRSCWLSGKTASLEIPEQMLVEGEGVSRLNSDIHMIRFYPDGSSSGGELTLSISGRPVYTFRVDMLMGLVTRIEEDA